ncbi:hypothetical protein GCM10027341_26100 [Spirosoma knui]
MKSVQFYVLLSWLCLGLANAQAQTDSVKTEYKTEDEKISSSEIKRFIRYITRADVEEKTLIKVGIWPASDQNLQFTNQKFRVGFTAEVAIERKITPSFSVFAGADGSLRFITYDYFQTPTSDPSTRYSAIKTSNFYINWKAGTRYYHGMANRIRKGKSANNFSGNYVTAQVSLPTREYVNSRFYDRTNQQELRIRRTENTFDIEMPRILVAYGIQRRLGRFGYFDVNAGPELRYAQDLSAVYAPVSRPKRSVTFQVNALIGFGW